MLVLCWTGVFSGSALAGHAHIRVPVSIPMRDVPHALAGDVYLPASSGKWPAVLIQTPYNKERLAETFLQDIPDGDPLLESPNYAFVVVDWRGKFASANAAYPGSPSRGEDGYDCVEWIARQDWCTGKVGTWGSSALGNVQMVTAAEKPPHLKGCVPRVCHFRDWYDQWYPGGVYAKSRGDFIDTYFMGGLGLYKKRPVYNSFWRTVEKVTGDPADIDVPMLHVSGWYDHETVQTIREMMDIQTKGGPNARNRQHMVIGPWAHESVGEEIQGQLNYRGAVWEDSKLALEFFDQVLRDIPNGFFERPTCHYYRMNADTWVDSNQFPALDTTRITFFLSADGKLIQSPATLPDQQLSYLSDPDNPVPTLFGAVVGLTTQAQQGPGDLSVLLTRSDVLGFATDPLTDPLIVEGSVVANFFITCTAPDTDLMVRLVDHYPDGRVMLLVDGACRASLRNDLENRQLLSPEEVYKVPVTLPPVSVEIIPGHRLGILVSSSNYDRFDKNMQDRSSLSDETGAVPTPAQISLQVNSLYQSSVTLPVIQYQGPDSDGDGFTDTIDAFPFNPDEWADSDADYLGDNFERSIINANTTDNLEDVLPEDDFDRDHRKNLQEFLDGTDPLTANVQMPAITVSGKFWIALLILSVGLMPLRNWPASRRIAVSNGKS